MKLLITWWDWRKEGSNVGVEMQDQPESGIDLPHSEMMSREMAGRSGRKRDQLDLTEKATFGGFFWLHLWYRPNVP